VASFRLTPDAIEDLDAIWLYIVKDNPAAAGCIEDEIRSACAFLAAGPLRGHLRQDVTKLSVRFWTLPKYPNYTVVYRPDSKPLEIIRVDARDARPQARVN
jgi:plasmid stabilization system protein ParE